MSSTIHEIGLYLTNVVFGIAIFLLMLRLLLGVAKASFFNPFSQMIVKATDPLVLPMRKMIPPIGKIDTAVILLMVILKLIQIFLQTKMIGVSVPASTVFMAAIGTLLNTMLIIYMVAIIIMVVFSWLSMAGMHLPRELATLISSLIDPLIGPVRRALPNLGGLDFSPLIVLVGIEVLRIVIRPLYQGLRWL